MCLSRPQHLMRVSVCSVPCQLCVVRRRPRPHPLQQVRRLIAHLLERTTFHSFTNPVQHEPRGFLSHANGAMQFVAGDSILAVADHPYCRHPLIEANRRILEYRSNLGRELLFAAIAKPELTSLNKRIALGFAARANNLAICPAEKLRIFKCASSVREVNHCLLKSYRFFHELTFDLKRIALLKCVSSILLP
jgi:hypothetical protein